MNRQLIFKSPESGCTLKPSNTVDAYSILITFGGGMGGAHRTIYTYTKPTIENNLIEVCDIYGVNHIIGVNSLVEIKECTIVQLNVNIPYRLGCSWFTKPGTYLYLYEVDRTDTVSFEEGTMSNQDNRIGLPCRVGD